MSTILVITDIDHVTVNGTACGSITNVIANRNATPQESHDALVAYVASLQSQIATQTAAATTATAALNTLHGQVDTIVESAIAAGSDVTALQACVAQAAPLSSPFRLAAKQAEVTKLQAALEAAQAAVAAHT